MWPLCQKYRVAAITYNGVEDTDLSSYNADYHPAGWNKIGGGAAKKSLSRFAWEIRGGDTVFVADSKSREIVGMGHPRAAIGQLAYRFDPDSPIATDRGSVWCHLIDMDWDDLFVPFVPGQLRAPLFTVLDLHADEVETFMQASQQHERIDGGFTSEELATAPLFDEAYPRHTPAALRLIRRKHATLSNQFKTWLNDVHQISALQERQQIDLKFEKANREFLVEFKIAYQGNTKRAIREALGQILEYNYYPPRKNRDHWLLVLDTTPCESDKFFVRSLRKTFHLPLSLGWHADSSFHFEPPLRF